MAVEKWELDIKALVFFVRCQPDKTYLPKLIQAVKKRHLELASRRSLSE